MSRSGGGSVLDVALARRGETRESVGRHSRTGKALRRNGVPACSEWQRIDALPRRVWTDEQADEMVELMTSMLRTPRGTWRLWRDQAVALYEIGEYGGLIGGLRVSGGKSLVAMLAATVCEWKRPMVIVPAKSINSGKIEKAYREAREHWRISECIQWVSYEMLQSDTYKGLLEKYRPDGVVFDEAHKVGRYADTKRTGRVSAFKEGEGARVPFVLLSGTFMSSHIVKDISTLCEWGLGEGSPVPRNAKAVKDWADALEVDPSFSKRLAEQGEDPRPRMAPGALARWCTRDEAEDLDGVRRGFGRRFTQTPGVVVSSGEAIGNELKIDVKLNAEHDAVIAQAFVELRGDPKNDIPPKTPDGWILVDAPVIWGIAQCLELGFYYRPDPRPPAEWTLARQTWAAYCRERMKFDESLECELHVANECRRLELEGEAPDAWLEWSRLRGTFKLNVVPVWLSDRRVEQAGAWLKKHKGLCWTQHTAFGTRVSQKFKIPYFSREACDVEGNSILEYPGGPAIASLAACSEDLNLQDRWHSNLVVCPPSTGQLHEQYIARTHRFGQKSPEVTVEMWVGCVENHEAIFKAIAKERAVANGSLDTARKLLVAEWTHLTDIPRKGRRWTRPSK